MSVMKATLDSTYIDDHISDLVWLDTAQNTHHFEGFMKRLLRQARLTTDDDSREAVTSPVTIEVEPHIFGASVEV